MDRREGDWAPRGALVAMLLAPALLATGCSDAGIFRRSPSAVTSAVLVTESAPVEPDLGRLRIETLASVSSDDERPRAGGRVEAAARQILADLRLGDHVPVIAGSGGVDASGRERDQLQRHVAAAWHFDLDPAVVDVLRVRLRALIASDGSVRAIEFIDSQGGPEDVRARFVEDAIATLDWSSPLPVEAGTARMRAFVFRFEAGPARR
jgi:hypothetical protein